MPLHNGSGDSRGKQQSPPLLHLSMVPGALPNGFVRNAPEIILNHVCKSGAVVLVDAGTPKVMGRLYGGVHPDFTSGGMWRNTAQFISNLAENAKANRLELVVTFDTSIDDNNLHGWLIKQEEDKEKITETVRYIMERGHPPAAEGARISYQLWFCPTALVTSLRLICVSLGIQVVGTLFEHEPELVAVPDVKDPSKQSWVDKCGMMFTNSLEYFCYSDVTVGNKALWGESLKLNRKGDKFTGGKIDRVQLAKFLGIREQSLDAGLLYYGTRYFLDAAGFDPIEDLHHQMKEEIKPSPNMSVGERVHIAVDKMRKVHQVGVNNEDSAKIGDSLVPSVDFIKKSLQTGRPLPPHFASLNSQSTDREIQAEWNRVRDRASDTFFKVGFRLLDGRVSQPPAPYYREGQRVLHAHQTNLSQAFLDKVEKLHRSGKQHHWIGQLIFGKVPTIRLDFTIGDYSRQFLVDKKWTCDPGAFFRNLRRRAYGFLFGVADFTSDQRLSTVREISFGSQEDVSITNVSKAIEKIAPSAEKLWEKDDKKAKMQVALRIIYDDRAPSKWLEDFQKMPTYLWLPIIALRYLIERFPRIAAEGYLDSLLATMAVLAVEKDEPLQRKMDMVDRTEEDKMLNVDVQSVTFACFFMMSFDHTVFVSDLVGGLVKPEDAAPWMFFDGNVFHTKLRMRKQMVLAGRGSVEELMVGRGNSSQVKNDKKIAMFLKLREFLMEGLRETDIFIPEIPPEENVKLLRASPETIGNLIARNLLPYGFTTKF